MLSLFQKGGKAVWPKGLPSHGEGGLEPYQSPDRAPARTGGPEGFLSDVGPGGSGVLKVALSPGDRAQGTGNTWPLQHAGGWGVGLGPQHCAALRRVLQVLGSLNWGEGVPEKPLRGSPWYGLALSLSIGHPSR